MALQSADGNYLKIYDVTLNTSKTSNTKNDINYIIFKDKAQRDKYEAEGLQRFESVERGRVSDVIDYEPTADSKLSLKNCLITAAYTGIKTRPEFADWGDV